MSELARALEALLFLSAEPVATGDLCDALDCSEDELAEAAADSADTPRMRVISGRLTGWR